MRFRRKTRLGRWRGSEPSAAPKGKPDDRAAASFTEADWEELSYSLAADGANPPPCPACGRTGFYGPRAGDGVPKCRACRFCGFFQEVEAEPTRLRPVVHDCDDWPECAGAPYVWWIPLEEKWYNCSFCHRRTAVEGGNPFVRSAAITAPSDDPSHPWWKVPQNESYGAYYKFWENWRCTKGRAIF